MTSRQMLLLSLSVMLVAAVALVVVRSTLPRERAFAGTLKGLLPVASDLPGWTANYRPVGETPEITAHVSITLLS